MSKKMQQQFACSRMMLPEHCGSLRRHADARVRAEEQRRPLADEQLQAEQQQLLEEALYHRLELHFTLLDESGRRSISGVPCRVNEAAGTIFIDTGSGKPIRIRAAAVIDIAGGSCAD